ncbi:redox-regulated ATPase YchF [Nanoarchaeota archaeon]
MLIGLVGKPSSGKSTFFKAATLAEVLIASYPFATIKPNHGMGYVKIECIDKEFKVQCNPRTGFCLHGWRFVPVELMDVAGLVPGAHEGKGLGNQFLDDLSHADAFLQIVDLSGKTNEKGEAADDYDVTKDIDFLENELDMWYLGLMEKVWRSFSRKASAEKTPLHEAVVKQFSGLKIDQGRAKEAILKSGLDPEKAADWSRDDLLSFAKILRKISKPMAIVANKCDTPAAAKNLKKLKEAFPNLMIVPCSAQAEIYLREMNRDGVIDYVSGEGKFSVKKELDEKQKKILDFIEENVFKIYGNTGVQQALNDIVFDLMKMIAIFPAGSKLADSKGNILPDCFLLPPGSTALDFAYHLHTDLGKQFIRAIDARTKRVVGKEHELKNRDGIEIIT